MNFEYLVQAHSVARTFGFEVLQCVIHKVAPLFAPKGPCVFYAGAIYALFKLLGFAILPPGPLIASVNLNSLPRVENLGNRQRS